MPQLPTVANTGAVAGLNPVASGGATASNPADAVAQNSVRLAFLAERLHSLVRTGQQTDPWEFFNLCLCLARGIDHAVTNNQVPAKAQDLPLIVKQVCKRKKELLFHVAIMVLLISIKSACRSGWFLSRESDELLTLANEVGSNFCSSGGVNFEPSGALPTISKIMTRFYPRLTLNRILVALEVKPGYGVFAADFHIPLNMVPTAQEKIRLFVAQTDNIETSSCIISPPHVNFLLNGKGVERRTNVSPENGPQFPSAVSSMVKYGTNLLQAVGSFNGNYIIVVAVMGVASLSDTPVLQDYVQPFVTALDSDSEIIEGPSRISLNCPISYRRINTPVKGHLCKHHQCFDYNNFMEINSRRPSWRCPHCNQSVCYTDLRVDQNMVKVLREVKEDVADVVISADGSWKAVLEIDANDQPLDPTISCLKDGSDQFSNSTANVFDLTLGGDDENDAMDAYETEDRKPFKDNLQRYSLAGNPSMPSEADRTSDVIQNNASQVEDSFWPGILLSISSTASGLADPILTDAISPAFNRERMDFDGQYSLSNNLSLQLSQPTSSLPQGRFSASNNLYLQPSQFGNSIINFESGRSTIPRHVSRTPIAIQALPAQTQVSNSQQRPQTSLNYSMPNAVPPAASHAAPSISGDTQRQQQFSRSPMMTLPASDTASSSMQYRSVSQNWDHLDLSNGLSATGQISSNYRASSGLSSDFQSPSHPQLPNVRVSQSMTQSSMLRPPSHLSRMLVQQGTQSAGGQAAHNARLVAASQRTTQMARPPQVVPVQLQPPRTGSPAPMNVDGPRSSMAEPRVGTMSGLMHQVSMSNGSADLPSDQNWRPTGRMRGSLVGQAYSAALSQFMMTQPDLTSLPTSPSQTYPRTGDNAGSRTGNLGMP